jgi:hypothetical protein
MPLPELGMSFLNGSETFVDLRQLLLRLERG